MNDKKYDLEERPAVFGEKVIGFLKGLKDTSINKSIKNQLVRSATSIGANYMEADGAESKRDFKHKIALCKKEAKETKHWLRMLSTTDDNLKTKCREIWKEGQELTLIFSAILRNANNKEKSK